MVPAHWREAALEPPRAFATPRLTGRLRTVPEDFQVEEELGFEPHGDGEHWLLRIRKRGANTEWVAGVLARHARVRIADVGFAGLKDRHAVAVQWFSVPRGAAPAESWLELENPEFSVLDVRAHARKLQRGALAGNRFHIRVRHLAGEREGLDARVALIRSHGVPNYFGPQRFGTAGGNLHALAGWAVEGVALATRRERSFTLSAGRSLVFNAVLAERVRRGNWNHLLAGDIVNLDGSGSIFNVDTPTVDLVRRCAALDIHPTGPLWGRGVGRTTLEAAELERAVVSGFDSVTAALEGAELRHERRSLRLRVAALEARIGEDLELTFRLGPGGFATTVLRELIELDAAGAGP